MAGSLRNYLTLVFLSLIWGSSFILMKRGLEVFDFIEVATLRIVIAFFSLTPFIFNAIRVVKRQHYFPLAISAFLGNGIPAFLFAKAQTELDSALVGTLNAIVPFFTLILGVYFFSARPSKANILGIFIGLLGIVILSSSALNEGIAINGYIFLVVLATIFYAISINVIKKYLQDLDASSIAALAFLLIGPIATCYLLNTSFLYQLQNHPDGYKALGYIALLAVLGTSMAAIIFNRLLSRSSAIFVSSITYLIPVIAIFWGVFDGEIITSYHISGCIIILSGVYLVNKKTPTQ
jgi:drug/metabolite transporter (DMT)-like permease